MKAPCGRKPNVVWAIVVRMVAGLTALLWLARWFVRLMPQAVGGEGVYAWAELAERAHRGLARWEE